MSEGSVALEIGPGENPLQLRKDIIGNKETILLERNHENIHGLKSQQLPKSQIIEGDAANIPLGANSVDVVTMANVFGAEGIGKVNKQKSGMETVDIGEKKLMEEIKRVCKPGGSVIIFETYSITNERELVEKFKKLGFKVAKDENNKPQRFVGRQIAGLFDTSTPENKAKVNAFISTSTPEATALVFKKE